MDAGGDLMVRLCDFRFLVYRCRWVSPRLRLMAGAAFPQSASRPRMIPEAVHAEGQIRRQVAKQVRKVISPGVVYP
jgi:hypothetical protein